MVTVQKVLYFQAAGRPIKKYQYGTRNTLRYCADFIRSSYNNTGSTSTVAHI